MEQGENSPQYRQSDAVILTYGMYKQVGVVSIFPYVHKATTIAPLFMIPNLEFYYWDIQSLQKKLYSYWRDF